MRQIFIQLGGSAYQTRRWAHALYALCELLGILAVFLTLRAAGGYAVRSYGASFITVIVTPFAILIVGSPVARKLAQLVLIVASSRITQESRGALELRYRAHAEAETAALLAMQRGVRVASRLLIPLLLGLGLALMGLGDPFIRPIAPYAAAVALVSFVFYERAWLAARTPLPDIETSPIIRREEPT